MTNRSTRPSIPDMADIAKLAGVSKSTVSRALSDSPLVNSKTKERIVKIAKEKNYRLNTAARNFRLKETLTIAVLLPSAAEADWKLSDPFFLEMLGCIAEALDDRGHQLLLSRTLPQEAGWIEEFIINRSADGMILIGQGSQHEALNLLAESYGAISVWGAKLDSQQLYPVVGTDNHLGGFRATEHLLQKNRKRIVFLGYNDLPEIQLRYNGYLAALKKYNIEFDPSLVKTADLSSHNSYLAMQELIPMGTKFDAIFAVSDVHAMSAIRALRNSGLSVPKDISVVGYDDISLSSYYNPPLTTIHQNRSIGAKILVDNLLEAIAGNKPEAIVLNPELIVREST